MMIGTCCRVAFLQYLPQKPCKFGVKVWVFWQRSRQVYVLGFQIYTGAALPAIPTEESVPKGLAYRVVMNLMDPYQNKGH